MKYLTTTFAIAFMACGFMSIAAIPAEANEESDCWWYERPECGHHESMRERGDRLNREKQGAPRLSYSRAIFNESMQLTYITKPEFCGEEENEFDAVCRLHDWKAYKTNLEQIVGCVEREDGDYLCTGGWKRDETDIDEIKKIVLNKDKSIKLIETEDAKVGEWEEADLHQLIAWNDDNHWGYWLKCLGAPESCVVEDEQIEHAYYRMPSISQQDFKEIIGETTYAEFRDMEDENSQPILALFNKKIDNIDALEEDHQFADREDGSGGDFGESGGGDFDGEKDRAAASTAAE